MMSAARLKHDNQAKELTSAEDRITESEQRL